MTAFHVVQLLALVGIAALVVERVRALCVRAPLDVEPFLRAILDLSAEDARDVVARAEGTLVARTIAPALESPPGEVDVNLEEGLALARQEATRGLSLLRVAATGSSFLGLVGAAVEIGWIGYGEHGLLGLDPTRLASIGLQNAMMSMALGVGGSSFALGCWHVLRGHARGLVHDCEKAVEILRDARGDGGRGWRPAMAVGEGDRTGV
jgi:biopolymer transport protein ExbB/TolQ